MAVGLPFRWSVSTHSASIGTEHSFSGDPSDVARRNFHRTERREWWLWLAAIAVTLLLAVRVVSFIVPELGEHPGGISWVSFPSAVRGLVAVVLLFDIYTIYQQLLIHRIRRKLFQGEELFALISDNASDMIAVVDMEGRRLYHSLSCQTVLGYSPEELKSSSAMAHIHLDDVDRMREASRLARVSGVGQTQEYRISTSQDTGW